MSRVIVRPASQARTQRSAPTAEDPRLRAARVLLISSLIIGTLWGIAASPYFTVETVRVNTPDAATAAYIQGHVKLPADATTLTYPLSWVAEAAMRCPLVRTAIAQRKLPREIVVTPELRQPMCAVSESDGCLLVDTEGFVFSRLAQRPAAVPLVQGLSPVPAKIGERIHPWYAWVLLPCSGAIKAAGLSEDFTIDVSNQHAIALHTSKGLECKLGGAEDLVFKTYVCSQIMAKLAQSGTAASYIDVRVPERPVWKPNSAADVPVTPTPSTKPAAKLATAKPKKKPAAPAAKKASVAADEADNPPIKKKPRKSTKPSVAE